LNTVSSDTLGNLAHVAFYQGDYERAEEYYAEGLRTALVEGGKLEMARHLTGLAMVDVAKAQPERALRQLSAASRLLGSIGAPLERTEQSVFARSLAAARAQLSRSVASTAWTEGQAMTEAQLIVFALEPRGR
jgi:hypothetical protein